MSLAVTVAESPEIEIPAAAFEPLASGAYHLYMEASKLTEGVVVTFNDEDYLFDFKYKSYETETLKISKESLTLKIKKEDIENVKSILDVLGFEQTSNIVRTRFVFVKDEVKFEIDDYIKPKMLVVAIEGKRDKVDKVYNEVKNMFDIVN